jgi:hypothetical protein
MAFQFSVDTAIRKRRDKMGHPTYEQLIEMLVDARDADYRSDPERDAARLNRIESILLSMLAKMRDNFDHPVR